MEPLPTWKRPLIGIDALDEALGRCVSDLQEFLSVSYIKQNDARHCRNLGIFPIGQDQLARQIFDSEFSDAYYVNSKRSQKQAIAGISESSQQQNEAALQETGRACTSDMGASV